MDNVYVLYESKTWDRKSRVYTKTCAVFIAVLYTTAHVEESPQSPSPDEQRLNGDVHTMAHYLVEKDVKSEHMAHHG